jgi:hypothetical protein
VHNSSSHSDVEKHQSSEFSAQPENPEEDVIDFGEGGLSSDDEEAVKRLEERATHTLESHEVARETGDVDQDSDGKGFDFYGKRGKKAGDSEDDGEEDIIESDDVASGLGESGGVVDEESEGERAVDDESDDIIDSHLGEEEEDVPVPSGKLTQDDIDDIDDELNRDLDEDSNGDRFGSASAGSAEESDLDLSDDIAQGGSGGGTTGRSASSTHSGVAAQRSSSEGAEEDFPGEGEDWGGPDDVAGSGLTVSTEDDAEVGKD